MTKLSDLGYYDQIIKKFIITDFDRSWEKTQKGTFIHTIWKIRFQWYEELSYKDDYTKMIITKDTISKLTKNTTTLINELVKDKVIKYNPEFDYYEVNNTKVYCQSCEYWLAEKNHRLQQKEKSEPFFEYEINKHLEREHYKNYRGYDGKGKVKDPITPEVIKEYIRYEQDKPEFETKDHEFQVVSIKLDRQYLDVTVRCKNCGQEEILRDSAIRACIKEKEKVKEVEIN